MYAIRSYYAAEAPAHRTIVPDLAIPRALNDLYASLRDEHKNRIANRSPATPAPGAAFTAVTDRCRPVLVEALAGREFHVGDPKNNALNYFEWDGHNYLEVAWSEPVVITSYSIHYTKLYDIQGPGWR